MKRFVLDASVAAKWFLPASGEPLSEQALDLVTRYAKGQVRLAVPDFFWAEFANVLWKAVRQGRWSRASAEKALSQLAHHRLPTVPTVKLIDEALSIACTFERPVYDCVYVALAVALNATVITADERLANAMAPHFPVEWLGAI
jgi:predicted nucleic acid-binding protein